MPAKLDDASRAQLEQNKLFTPKFVWIVFVLTEFITFFDRGAVSGALQQIRQDSKIAGGPDQILDGTRAGLLTSMFITGFLIFSPIFTALAGKFTTRTLLVAGSLLWLFSVLLSGAAPNYPTLVFARCVTGVGEAAYTPFMVTIIDNIAPVKSRTLWIGIWYAMIAFGTAFGMGVGAVVSSKVELSDGTPGWRLIFYLETIFGAAFSLLMFLMPKEYNIYQLEDNEDGEKKDEESSQQQQQEEAGENNDEAAGYKDQEDHEQPDHHVSIIVAVKEILLKNHDFNIIGFSYGLYNWMTGAAAAWLVQTMTQSTIDLTQSRAGLIVGGIMAFCGLTGSAIGGLVVDKYAPVTHPQSVIRATLFSAICMLVAFPLAGTAILSQSLWLFIVTFVPAVFLLFALVPAITVALLGVVPSHLRPYSISISMIYQHALGDAISPTVSGALSTQFGAGCAGLSQEVCEWMNFDNATFDEGNNWLDGECKWIPAPHKGDSPYCANTMQLNKALFVTLCVSAVSIVGWLFVALKRKCCHIAGEADPEGLLRSDEDDDQQQQEPDDSKFLVKKNQLKETTSKTINSSNNHDDDGPTSDYGSLA